MIDLFEIDLKGRLTIHTIQKLCYPEETAIDAIKLLYKLANEEGDLKEKAKNTFYNIFHVHLAETSLSLIDRLKVITKITEEYNLSEVVISTYENALKAYGFVGDIHSADSNYLSKQYKPSSKEIIEYYKNVLNELNSIFTDNNEFSNLAKNAIINKMTDQLVYGDFDDYIEVVEGIIDREGEVDIRIRRNLLHLLSSRYQLNDEQVDVIENILSEHTVDSVKDELRTILIEAPWVREKDGNAQFVNISEIKAKELAEKYILEGDEEWVDHLGLLLKGEQRFTYFFAHKISSSGIDKDLLLELLFNKYLEIPVDEQNWLFVNGLIIGLNDDNYTRKAIEKFLSSPNTERVGITLVKLINEKELKDFEIIKPHLIERPDFINYLEYIYVNNLCDDDLIVLTQWLKDINYSYALDILYGALSRSGDQEEERWNGLKKHIEDLVFVDDIFTYSSSINNTFHIEDLIKKCINNNPENLKIERITKLIIEHYRDFQFTNTSLLDHISYFLLENHWQQSWVYFGHDLVNSKSNYGLNAFLRNYHFNNENLFSWAREQPEIYPQVAVQYMDVFVQNDDGTLALAPSVIKIIDQFGNNKMMLARLEAKFVNFSINSASAKGLYLKRKTVLEGLLNHKTDEVKEFASRMLEYVDRAIVREQKFIENYKLGY